MAALLQYGNAGLTEFTAEVVNRAEGAGHDCAHFVRGTILDIRVRDSVASRYFL